MKKKKAQVKSSSRPSKAKPKSKFAQLYRESLRILGRHSVRYPNPNDILIR